MTSGAGASASYTLMAWLNAETSPPPGLPILTWCDSATTASGNYAGGVYSSGFNTGLSISGTSRGTYFGLRREALSGHIYADFFVWGDPSCEDAIVTTSRSRWSAKVADSWQELDA